MSRSAPRLRRRLGVGWATLVFALLLALAAAAPALAGLAVGGGVWEWQSPLPQGNRLYDVEVAPEGAVWAVGAAGTLLRSDDGGISWASSGPAIDVGLTSVDFTDELKGHVVGRDGTYLATDDGGSMWTVRTLGEDDLWAVEFVDEQKGFITGDDGLVRMTTDGGATWLSRTVSDDSPLYGLSFYDPLHGWACGADGYVARTTDGGSTWTGVGHAGFSDLYGIDFTDSDTGWAVGESDIIYGTTDGGQHWEEVRKVNGLWLSDVDALGTSVVAVGEGGTAVLNTPSEDWTIVSTQGGDWLYGVAWDEEVPTHAVAVGDNGAITVSTDGCMNFLARSGATDRTIEAVSVVDPQKAVAVGMSGVALYTENGGDQWVRLPSAVCSETLLDVSMADGTYGCAVGEYGRVATTADGGHTWVERQVGPGDLTKLEGVCMVSPSQGWAVGRQGRVFHTVDYGVSWTQQPVESPVWFQAVDFVDEQYGWAVAERGNIFATSSGGSDPDGHGPLLGWTAQSSGVGFDLHAVDFVDRDHGWAVGAASTIIHTEDGGQTWVKQHPFVWAPQTDFTGVAFVDRLNGWIVGSTGRVLVTHDGGDTWVLQTAGAHPWFEDVDAVVTPKGEPRVWATGRRLAIVALRSAPETTPPVTTDNAPAGWSHLPITVTFAATDAESGAARTTWRAAGGLWQLGTSHTVAAPDDHTNDGPHTIEYFSEDHAGNREAVRSCTVRVDTIDPESTDDAPPGWARVPVRVTFSAHDERSGVARVTSRVDGGLWQLGESCVVAAPATHTNDGVHTVEYFAEDNAGNREAVNRCTVRIDTRRPVCKAPRSASVRRKSYVTLKYRVDDGKPNAGTAKVTITVKTLGGKKVKTFKLGSRKVNTLLSYRFRCTLAKKTYKFYVTAVDAAGNPQTKTGVNKLVVK